MRVLCAKKEEIQFARCGSECTATKTKNGFRCPLKDRREVCELLSLDRHGTDVSEALPCERERKALLINHMSSTS